VTPSVEVRLVTGAAERELAYRIRDVVFVEEQHVPSELEHDEYDEAAEHLLAYVDGDPIGTGRLVIEPGAVGHLGRLAVLDVARGSGVGVALVRGLEDRARALGLRTMVLGAQLQAIGFYERLGYSVYGAEFDDAGIRHRWMRRQL
jgi:predicted GNAT family N-acyltransferase